MAQQWSCTAQDCLDQLTPPAMCSTRLAAPSSKDNSPKPLRGVTAPGFTHAYMQRTYFSHTYTESLMLHTALSTLRILQSSYKINARVPLGMGRRTCGARAGTDSGARAGARRRRNRVAPPGPGAGAGTSMTPAWGTSLTCAPFHRLLLTTCRHQDCKLPSQDAVHKCLLQRKSVHQHVSLLEHPQNGITRCLPCQTRQVSARTSRESLASASGDLRQVQDGCASARPTCKAVRRADLS